MNSPVDEQVVFEAIAEAYAEVRGAPASVSVGDIYEKLGCRRGSRAWDGRQKVISSRRIRDALRAAGFVSVLPAEKNHRAGRYVLAADMPETGERRHEATV